MTNPRPLPLLSAELAFTLQTLQRFAPGEPVDASVLRTVLTHLETTIDFARRCDLELALHRELMDETHARKIASALGAHPQPETMQ